jgi:hypothetical protein
MDADTQSLQHRDSLASLLQLDPSPIDSPSPSSEKREPFPALDGSHSHASIGSTTTQIGLGGRGAIYYRLFCFRAQSHTHKRESATNSCQ